MGVINAQKLTRPKSVPTQILFEDHQILQQQKTPTAQATPRKRVTFSISHRTEGELIQTTPPQHRQHDYHVETFADDIGLSFQKKRDQQVKEMCAGRAFAKPHPSQLPPWPKPTDKLMQKWLARNDIFKTYSERYMAAQTTMLFLADLNPIDRFENFEKWCFLRVLAPSTAETYWTTWLGIQKALALAPSEADSRITRVLKARAVAYPVMFPTPASTQDIVHFINKFQKSHPSLTAIVAFTFLNGQRISDMVQLAVADLSVEEKFLAITVRRGKTFTTAKPYTLWIRRGMYPCEALIEAANQAAKCQRMFLFTEMNLEEQRRIVLDAIHHMLADVNDQLELRSIRRGGLHLMAQNGCSMETILKFSRHSDIDMLMRYLNWGSVSTACRNEMLEALSGSAAALDQATFTTQVQTATPTHTNHTC